MKHFAFTLIVLLLIAANATAAEDNLTLTYTSGYPPPDQSSGTVEIQLTRFPVTSRKLDIEIDRFFADVGAVLKEYKVNNDWALVQPDSAYVRISIKLDGRRWELASSFPPGPIHAALENMDVEVRHQHAFEKIRLFVHEHIQKRLRR